MRLLGHVFVLLLLAGGCLSSVYADTPAASDPNTPQAPERSAELGFGIAYRSPIYRGVDADYLPIPLVFYKKGAFFVRGTQVGYQFYRNGGLTLEALGEWVWRGYDDDDSRHLRGMDDRDPTILGGAAASYYDGWGVTRVDVATDLLGKSNGQELTFSYGKQFVQDKWTLTPLAGVRWESSDMADYYFGVDADEVTPTRPQYSAGESWTPFVSLATRCRINEKWSSMIMVRYDWLDDEISDSPIVNKDYQIKLIGGLVCRF